MFLRQLRYAIDTFGLFFERGVYGLVARYGDAWGNIHLPATDEPYYVCIDNGKRRIPLPLVLGSHSGWIQNVAFTLSRLIRPGRFEEAVSLCQGYIEDYEAQKAVWQIENATCRLKKEIQALRVWDLKDDALRGNPSFFKDIQIAALKGQIVPLVPLFQRVFDAKRWNERPAERGTLEESALYWGWGNWTLIQTGTSGMRAPVWSLYLKTAQADVKVASYFAGDRCNAPGTHDGWDRA
jgi:hypothetical protein